ncbi:MAG: trypsin-like peptidase domain-containing protein [bacterium]
MTEETKSIKKIIIITVITSLIVGTLAGGSAGFLVGLIISPQVTNWLGQAVPTITKQKTIEKVNELEQESATIAAVKKISPAVVSIIITKDLSKFYNMTDPNSFPFNNFFDFGFPYQAPPQGQQEIGGGSGFIISADGMIITNRHVVSDSEAEYTVLTNDGKKYDAKVLAQDSVNDVAVVKIEAKNLPTVELGDSDKIQIGQSVIAIGNALGEYRNTVTRGVISGIGRTITAGTETGQSEVLEDVIQTDAAINPGNSGGPLVDLNGKVIGINTAINQQGQLIGFAIPINDVKPAITSVEKTGKIVRSFLGVRYVLINDVIAKANNLKVNYGALVIRGQNPEDLAVVPGGPADKAGISENDIILEINGQKIDQNHSLTKIISKFDPNKEVTLKILHRGEEKEVKVKLGEKKSE